MSNFKYLEAAAKIEIVFTKFTIYKINILFCFFFVGVKISFSR